MGKADNAVLEVRPGPGQAKTIPIPITAQVVLQADGTAQDVSTANPAPVSSVPGALVTKVPTWNAKAVASAGTTVPIVASSILVTSIRVMAKTETGDNTGSVYIGPAGVAAGLNEFHELGAGDTWELIAANGTCFDLATLYIGADADDDGITFVYTPA